jgi:IS5 family transposase
VSPPQSAARCAAAEPVIGHIKAEHKGRDRDRIYAVLAAAGCNFGLLLRWLEASCVP